MEVPTEPEKRFRILIVTPLTPPESGGPSYYSVHLAQSLEALGHVVSVLAFRRVRHYPSGLRHLVLLYMIMRSCRHADVVIALDTVSVALPSVLAALLVGRPVYLRTGGDFVWERYIERTGTLTPLSVFYTQVRDLSYKERALMLVQRRIIFPFATKLVFSTAWQRDIWMKPYRLRKERTLVIQNAYSVQVKSSVPMHERGMRFVWVGRDLVLKNREGLRAAFTLLKEKCPEATLVELSDVPQAEAHAQIARSRCLVLPSVSEVSPNLLFESLCLGTPVIALEDTGVRSLLEGVVYFVDSLNTGALSAAMADMLDPAQYAVWLQRTASFTGVRTYGNVASDFVACINGRL